MNSHQEKKTICLTFNMSLRPSIYLCISSSLPNVYLIPQATFVMNFGFNFSTSFGVACLRPSIE